VKEKLNFCWSTIKGGVMYKKVLALLLVCFFGISNICGAATMASFSPVDNMALQSFLDGTIPASSSEAEKKAAAEMRANLETMLNLLTEGKYANNKKAIAEIKRLWDDNTGGIAKREEALAIAGITIVDKEIMVNNKLVGRLNTDNKLEFSHAEREILVQNLEKLTATIGNDVSDEALNDRAENMHATGRALTAAQSVVVANWINIWEANVNKASLTSEEETSERAAIADARAKLANGNLLIGEAQVDDAERFVIEAHKGIGVASGQATIAKEWLDADEKVGADMLGHAFRVENGMAGHKAALSDNAVQAKVSGAEVMAETKKTARNIIDIAAAKVKSAADDMVANLNADAIRAGGDAATKEAEALKKNSSQLAAVETAQVVTILTNVLEGFSKDANKLTVEINNEATKEVDNAALDADIAKLENDEKIGFYQSTLVQKIVKNGKANWVGTFPGIKIFQRLEEIASKSGSKLLPGSLNIIGTNDADIVAMKADLKATYPNLFKEEIIAIHTGTERQLLTDGTFISGSTTVAFSNEDIIGVTGIDYVHVQNVQKTNGLKLLAQVLAPRGEKINGAEQAILAEIQAGTLKTPDLTVADEAAYTQMFDKYLQVIELRTKA